VADPEPITSSVIVTASTASALDFATIYATWFHDVSRWCRAFGCPDADLDDLTQDVFVVVQRTLPRFDGRNLPGWLYRITSRAVRDHRRKSWFRNLFLRPRDVVLDQLEHGSASPAELFEQKRAGELLDRLLATLSEKRRLVFVLFEIEGYSGEEIAALECIPVATVWTRLHHARKDLAERLAKQDDRGGTACAR
jgi:RNA polymerase sigma-70 factor, ECF subfamily